MANKKKSRTWMILGTGILLAVALTYAFWPRPVLVDMGQATQANMVVTIDEEAKTQVSDTYVLSAPIAGQLLRVDVEPGDSVEGGQTTVARMLPVNPAALDIRTRQQGLAAINSAEAALRMARADLNKARANQDLADTERERTSTLYARRLIAKAAFDQANNAARAAGASADMSKAAIAMREADLANARAQLIGFDDKSTPATSKQPDQHAIPLKAPVSGRILQVMQRSATTLTAGTPILEIGDVTNDLEVLVELLSTDAVKVAVGNRVLIDNWGGAYPLNGIVERVEPWGFTKVSALGVEEQRVNAIIQFTDPVERRASLGHGFRVEAQIVVWEAKDALTVPSSALFRDAGGWAVFTVDAGVAHLKMVKVGQNNGSQAQITEGVNAGDSVILYPGSGLVEGMQVAQRVSG
ncbi:HlyD family efflux transporter periplasmic adaptor subunit [Thiothrix lacustris]|uniref:HlyD family efflux transporter periplasmic adaptor subunit n=1 Tax=Thiothrix lacustris TaxID=525917 RepID=A0ABY9MTM7_9GAMM|nr:HlyD family efflux transporter periplasmic adaptor subunit [Thiothrix lacustris]WML91858.1 HlyD family efflux transporter periplasmic adaptor subunit [Thiothrix lacustris]